MNATQLNIVTVKLQSIFSDYVIIYETYIKIYFI